MKPGDVYEDAHAYFVVLFTHPDEVDLHYVIHAGATEENLRARVPKEAYFARFDFLDEDQESALMVNLNSGEWKEFYAKPVAGHVCTSHLSQMQTAFRKLMLMD